ncbi:MAG: hypothetical protein ABL896_05210, partial [Hylemonella sp.]
TVIVPNEATAHAWRRDLAETHSALLIGTRFTTPIAAAIEVLELEGAEHTTGEEAVRAARIVGLLDGEIALAWFDLAAPGGPRREVVTRAGADGRPQGPRENIVSGWSAGGHLTALCLDEPGVIGGVAVSGIYDLAPVRLSYLNAKLGLSAAEETALSPVHQPLSPRPLALLYGGAELPELQRQSELFAAARRGLPGSLQVLAGHNHFTILNELAASDGAITDAVRTLAGLGTLFEVQG